MADQLPLVLQPAESPLPQRRGRVSKNGKPLGRPPGARNKASMDLGKYIAAQYGSTPGQQIAQLAMVTPAQVKKAKAEALELGIDPAGLSALELAHLVKAKRLAKALGVSTAEAYAAAHKARVDLLPYMHQKQPRAADPKTAGALPVAYLIPEGEAHQVPPALDDGEDEGLEILEVLQGEGAPVGNGQSDDA